MSLRAAIMTRTGQDVRRCGACEICNSKPEPGMDLTLGELMLAVAHDEALALNSSTIWEADELLFRQPRCLEDLDLASIILALQDEARKRGIEPK